MCFAAFELANQGGKLPDEVIKCYVSLVSNLDSLRGSFGFYQALDATLAQNEKRKAWRLPMPVLAIGGEASHGAHVGDAMKLLADDVQSVVIPGTGQLGRRERTRRDVLAALKAFLAPYREAALAR